MPAWMHAGRERSRPAFVLYGRFVPRNGILTVLQHARRHTETPAYRSTIAHSATRGTPPDSLPQKRIQRMNKDIIAGKWTQIKGQAQQKWGKLTDDVFDTQQGDSKYLAGKLQEQYGWDRDRAETEVRDFERTLNS
jgi:uncharacterized protein YjbJ (UPF0337 family)